MRFRERKWLKERKKEASRRKESFPAEFLTGFFY
jgi:hypothetical protein